MLSLSQSFPSNADYICNEEDDAIIKSISGYDDERLVVRVDDTFVTFESFKCLLSPYEYLNGDVSIIYVKKFSVCCYTHLYFCMVILNKSLHLIAGYKRVHIPH